MKVAIDSSVLIGLVNPHDLWHSRVSTLQFALENVNAEIIYFDCVISESISAIVRRLYEKKRIEDINMVFKNLDLVAPAHKLTWVTQHTKRLYTDVFNLMKQSSGELNFNDALIALVCKEQGVPYIASFDADFDRIPWLTRWATPADIAI